MVTWCHSHGSAIIVSAVREMHGVIAVGWGRVPDLKETALLFDKFRIVRFNKSIFARPEQPALEADLAYLEAQGIAENLSDADEWRGFHRDFSEEEKAALKAVDNSSTLYDSTFQDLVTRRLALSVSDSLDVDAVPLCQQLMPETLGNGDEVHRAFTAHRILQVGLDALPVLPDSTCAWQDILEFKTDARDKAWGFRRFLQSLIRANRTEAEIRDEIDWMVNEYRKAMELHHLKASAGVVDVFVITPLEIIENLVKFNWSKIAKGMLQVQKRKVELMEAEMKAAGRECAYVFDARNRFPRISRS
jgi:hypothetical protein